MINEETLYTSITCDRCGETLFFEDEFFDEDEAKDYAQNQGWTYDSYEGDLCPDCSK